MITTLQIRNFRGLKDVALRELRLVNLLVGGNDTGKTSVLEAIILLLGEGSAISELPVSFRNNQTGGHLANDYDERENFWAWLFFDHDPSNEIAISATIDAGPQVSISMQNAPPVLIRNDKTGGRQLVVFEPGRVKVLEQKSPESFRVSRLSVRPSHPVADAEKYNQVALEREGEERFERIMKEGVEPRLKRLRYAKLPGTGSPLVFADIGLSRAIPVPQMGQAFNRLLHIYSEILAARTNVLLVDEIENGVFTANLLPIWKGLFAVCAQENVQVFATTHSLECVRAAVTAATERGKDELGVQRMQVANGRIEAVALSQETIAYALENNLEIRQ